MGKITDIDRNVYHEKVKVYNLNIRSLLKTEEDMIHEAKKNEPGGIYKKLVLADEMLNLASNYMAVNGVSFVVLRGRNEEALNDARKSLYKAVIYLEETVTNYVDAPFSDYEEKVATIETYDENERYRLIRKFGLAIDLLERAYGDNSKWRWTFVELEGRFAVVAKNMIDLRNVMINTEPESPYYDSTVYHLRLVKKLLAQSADRYREKYELSTGEMPDFKTGIYFLSALRRLHIVLSESEEAEEIKKKINIWTNKLDADMKKREEAKKRS